MTRFSFICILFLLALSSAAEITGTHAPQVVSSTHAGALREALPKLVFVPAEVQEKSCQKLDFPKIAMKGEPQGVTTLELLIRHDGRVDGAKVIQSSGVAALDNAALVGLTRCKFKPAIVNGQRKLSWTKLDYVWKRDTRALNSSIVQIPEDKAGEPSVRAGQFGDVIEAPHISEAPIVT